MYSTNYKTGGYEQARTNFRQLNQDVSSGTPSLGTNTFTAMEEPISLTSTSIFKYYPTYEIYFYSFLFLTVFATVFLGCANDAMEIPKLRWQPDSPQIKR
jgi:hypothetical protein